MALGQRRAGGCNELTGGHACATAKPIDPIGTTRDMDG